MQQLPAENIKPFLTMKISKNQVAGYTLVKILVSFFSWAFLLFAIPFAALLIFKGNLNAVTVLLYFAACISMVFINTFVNTIINKSDKLMYSLFGLMAIIGGLHYFELIDVLAISESIFYGLYQNIGFFIIPIVVLLVLAVYTFSFIKKNLYLDRGLEMKKAAGKTENIAFLNKYGTLGTFINNDIRLIKRSKAARSALIG